MSLSTSPLAEHIVNRILPAPKQVTALEGAPLKRASAFSITAPTAEFGPVKTAGERIRALLCAGEGTPVQVTLSVEEPTQEHPVEGYHLTVTETAVDIVGYGEAGLLHGVITLEQLFAQDTELAALDVVDWPDNPVRGFKEESRYGSNVMTEEEWMELLEDLAAKKINVLAMSLYGCWSVQYDGRISQYIYMPVKNRPELNTPMVVKYYSPKEEHWIEEELLPPIFCGNVLEKVFAKARDLGIQVVPLFNSFGHNTLLPTLYPETAPVDENGVRQKYGFCTSAQATYDLLFSLFDELVDTYMTPYGMDSVSLGLDEVHPAIGKDVADPRAQHNPWCQCPRCKDQDRGDIFINHAVKLMAHLKSKGIKQIYMACDMIQEGRVSKLGWLGDRLLDACRKADVLDTLRISWWSYHDIESKNWIKSMYPEKGLKGVVAPWNGYHTWSIALQALRNVELLAHVNHRDGGQGILAYSMWDRACDRTHDAIAEYSWGIEQAGTTLDVTARYVSRHFPGHEKEAYRAYRLMDHAMEQRHTKKWSFPDREAVSYLDLMTYRLSPYNYCYVKPELPYPRSFLDEALSWVLTMRDEIELALFNISHQAEEACRIFTKLAQTPGVDQKMAYRQLCEAKNYLVLAQDWLAILEMHDLCSAGKTAQILPILESRYQARLKLMTLWEQHKERCVTVAMGLRLQSIFLQLYRDLADFVTANPDQQLDMTDIRHVLSPRSFWLR